MIFYVFVVIVNKSNKKTKTGNALIRLSVLSNFHTLCGTQPKAHLFLQKYLQKEQMSFGLNP